MRLIDPKHPFLQPAWRRYLIVAACFGWAVVEFTMGNEPWAIWKLYPRALKVNINA